jgi:hypothetical protein
VYTLIFSKVNRFIQKRHGCVVIRHATVGDPFN